MRTSLAQLEFAVVVEYVVTFKWSERLPRERDGQRKCVVIGWTDWVDTVDRLDLEMRLNRPEIFTCAHVEF